MKMSRTKNDFFFEEGKKQILPMGENICNIYITKVVHIKIPTN